MRAGKDALKVATAATDVDKVADVMEDLNERSVRGQRWQMQGGARL